MNRATALRLRREALLARSAHLRLGLVEEGQALRAQLAGFDRGLGWVCYATRRPVLLAAAGAALLIFKPTRALSLIARGAMVVSLARRALGLLDRTPTP
jgi:hypothetical protein